MLLSKELARLEWSYVNGLFEFTPYETACCATHVYFYFVKMIQVN